MQKFGGVANRRPQSSPKIKCCIAPCTQDVDQETTFVEGSLFLDEYSRRDQHRDLPPAHRTRTLPRLRRPRASAYLGLECNYGRARSLGALLFGIAGQLQVAWNWREGQPEAASVSRCGSWAAPTELAARLTLEGDVAHIVPQQVRVITQITPGEPAPHAKRDGCVAPTHRGMQRSASSPGAEQLALNNGAPASGEDAS